VENIYWQILLLATLFGAGLIALVAHPVTRRRLQFSFATSPSSLSLIEEGSVVP
jgi:hypothetical protein